MLRLGGKTLLGVLVAGQGVFAAYLAAGYGRTALAGNVAMWAKFSAHGWISGDHLGNASMIAHIVVAAAVLLSGGVQLVPWIRRSVPSLHRWSGRLFLSACMVGALSGLLLVWVRGTVGDRVQHIAISVNAVLLLVASVMAWRRARQRDRAAHRLWALRAFVVAGGVFYFRILLALWLLVHRRPVGFDAATFSGPFLTTLAIAVYVVVPLGLLELYLRAERSGSRLTRAVASLTTLTSALLCAAGTVAAALVLWLPKLT
jgi:hypothetical protein